MVYTSKYIHFPCMSLPRIYHDNGIILAVGKLMLEGLGDSSVVAALNVKLESLSFLFGTKRVEGKNVWP